MADPFIPRPDTLALAWMQNFSQKLSDFPGTYMVSPAEAAAISNAVAGFAAAMGDIADPDQKTKVAVAVKDEARNAAEQLCRKYAALIKPNDAISNPDKIAAGVRPINPSREPIPCPQTAPKINVVGATFGTHTLKYADSINDESGARPFGASELQLFVAIDDEPVTDWREARFYGKFTKNPVAVAFTPDDNSKTATYYARWAGSRGDVSPWSQPVYLAIAA